MIALMRTIRKELPERRCGDVAVNTTGASSRKRARAALLTWCSVYPVLTLTYVIAGSWLIHLPLALRTFCVVTVVVPIVSCVVQPLLNALLERR